jgi:flagellar biosynthesis/type III secretory pathway protein FliH
VLLGLILALLAVHVPAGAISTDETRQIGEDTGYSIGYEQGREDRNNDRSFNDELRGVDDTEGYTKRLKHKDNYKRGFREGYRQGYRAAYYSGGRRSRHGRHRHHRDWEE